MAAIRQNLKLVSLYRKCTFPFFIITLYYNLIHSIILKYDCTKLPFPKRQFGLLKSNKYYYKLTFNLREYTYQLFNHNCHRLHGYIKRERLLSYTVASIMLLWLLLCYTTVRATWLLTKQASRNTGAQKARINHAIYTQSSWLELSAAVAQPRSIIPHANVKPSWATKRGSMWHYIFIHLLQYTELSFTEHLDRISMLI